MQASCADQANAGEPQPHASLDAEHDATVALLSARGAQRLAHPGGSLLDHLCRTARRLQAWGAASELVAAALCHAAYGTDGYPTPLFALAERDLLRAQIGDAAEALVYAYCARDRTLVCRAGEARPAEAQRAVAPQFAASHEQRDRFSGEYWIPSAEMQHQLAELTVANELDICEHAALCGADHAAIRALVAAAAPQLSPASWSTLLATPLLRDAALRGGAPRGDHSLAYRELGSAGAALLLWHGGAAPELTWARQHGLAAELQLRIPWRRGFTPSCAAPHQDWAADARDLLRIMPDRAHVVAHSYGGVSALVAAASAPERFASLTIIEAPLWSYAIDDPDVQHVAALGREFARGAPDARRAFLELAGLPLAHPQALRTERLARNFRDPGEAAPALTRLRAAHVPSAIVSGAHSRAIEVVCDAVANALRAQRWLLPGGGHAPQRTAEFTQRLRGFIAHAHVVD